MKNSYLFILIVLVVLGNSQFTTIAIVGLNDIHGTALPTQMQRQDTKEDYTYGGLMYMASLIEIIKSEYPEHTLILDAGDQFQGGIEASPLISSGKIMNDFYDAIQTSGSAIGNHEFDFGPDFLLPYLGSKEAPTLAANIRSEKGESEFLPQQKLSQIYDFKSGIRIGVIGLSTIFTPSTTNAFKDKKFPEYKFLNYTDIVIAQSKKLKKNGANAVLIVGHLGNDCSIGNTYGKWTVDTKQPDCGVLNDQVSMLIDSLPNGTIDGILQGHRHKFAHHFYKGIPYLGSINGGYYFNVLYLKFQKTKLIQKVIEGPIPVCQKVFANFGTCEYLPNQKLRVAGQLLPYRFHNRQVTAHPKVKAIYEQEWIPKMADFLQVVATTQIYLYSQTNQECELSNLITSLIHQTEPQSDFVIINSGGLRTSWYPGQIQYRNFYNMFPFINYLISFDMTGSQLLQMLTIVQAGPLGFYPMYGVNQVVGINQKQDHRFISATMADGSPIEPDRVYRGISVDFLLGGGDDFKDFIAKYTPRNTRNIGLVRDVLRKPLQNLGVIRQGSLIDPDNPRLIVVK